MAFYADEEEVWKCPKHPSKRRRSGICPTCLRERLTTLCPDCANVRPCSCCPSESASSSSSSSSSFSNFFSRSGSVASRSVRLGSVGRVSNLIESEPSFQRSRSVAVPFFRSRVGGDRDSTAEKPPSVANRSKLSFLYVFRKHKKKAGEEEGREDEEAKTNETKSQDDYMQSMMMKSRSVSVPVVSDSGNGNLRSSSTKGRFWHFPSPIKAFRHARTPKVVQEGSPLYRG